nr:hypothetical protein CFP56_59988 [Quercus suber]
MRTHIQSNSEALLLFHSKSAHHPQSSKAETPKLGKMPISSGNEQGKESNAIAGTSRIPPISRSFYRIFIFSEEMLESTKPRMTSSLATLASTCYLSRAKELKGSSDERPALFSGNPLESIVIELASGSKTGLQNQPDAELTAPISKTKESLPS